MDFTYKYISPVTELTLASDGENLTGLWMKDQKYFASTLGKNSEQKYLPVFKETVRWLDLYFSGAEPDFTPPLSPKGSTFRQAVWSILLQIPYGSLITYGDIAKKLAKSTGKESMSAQAVGGAVGHNPISIIIPCHRVVGSSGSLTGYAGGIETKLKLLTLEKVDINGLYIPKKGTAL